MQTNEILQIENFTYLSIRLEIFGWIYIEREGDRQNLVLNDLQVLICLKTQTTNQPSLVPLYERLNSSTTEALLQDFIGIK